LAKPDSDQKPKLTATEKLNKGRDFIKTGVHEIKTHWNTPRPGFDMPYREWGTTTLATSCDRTHDALSGFLSFSAGCYLIMRYYQVDNIDFMAINLIGAPLGYFWSILGWGIADNLGRLAKKTERKLIAVYSAAIAVGLAFIIFCPVSFGEAFIQGFGKIFGIQVFLAGYGSIRDLLLRKYLIPKYGRYKFWPYVNAPLRVIAAFFILFWNFKQYNYGDMLWRLYLCFSIYSGRTTAGFVANMYRFCTTNNDERLLLECYPVKIGYFLRTVVADWTLPILATQFGGPENIRTMRWLYLPFMIVSLVPVLITFHKLRERLPQPPIEKKVTFSFWEGVTGVLRNKYRWITMISGTFDTLGTGARLARDCIWFYMLRMTDGIWLVILLTITQLYMGPGGFVAPFIIKRFDFKKLYMVSRAIAVTCDIFELLAVIFFNQKGVVTLAVALIILNFITNTVMSPSGYANSNMGIKINNYQMWLSGERLENYQSIFGWIQAPIIYLIALIIPVLYRTYGLTSDYDVLFNESVRYKVWVFGALLCIVGDIICIFPYAFFNYSNRKHEQIMEEQKERTEAAWIEAEAEGSLTQNGTIGRPSSFTVEADEEERKAALKRKQEKEAELAAAKAKKTKRRRFSPFRDEKDYVPLPVFNKIAMEGWQKKLYRKEDIEGAINDAAVFEADGGVIKRYLPPRKFVLKKSVKVAVSIILAVTITASLGISFKTLANAKAEKYAYSANIGGKGLSGYYLEQFSGLSSETEIKLYYAKKEIKPPLWRQVMEYFSIVGSPPDVYITGKDGKYVPIVALGDFSLPNNSYLTSITLGPEIRYIGTWVFNNCPSLREIKVDPANKWFKSVDGVLYTIDGKELIAYPEARGYNSKDNKQDDNKGWVSYSSYKVPHGVAKIWDYAFYKVDTLTSVTFPSTLKEIGEMAFWTCNGLSSLKLNEGLEVIAKDAFSYDVNLEGDIIFPSTLRSIGDFAFSKDKKITGFTFNMTKAEFEKRGVTANGYRWNYRTGASDDSRLKFRG